MKERIDAVIERAIVAAAYDRSSSSRPIPRLRLSHDSYAWTQQRNGAGFRRSCGFD